MDKQALREWVWAELERTGAARFPRPVRGRIPNFAGAGKAAEHLRRLDVYRAARVVKVGPDSPLHPVRAAVLADGKTLLMPTPRLRAGFVRLSPDRIPPGRYREATSLAHYRDFGEEVPLPAVEPVDLIVAGSVAVSTDGARAGKGEGYGDLEYAVLRELGKAPDGSGEIPVVTVVHPLQVVDAPGHPLQARVPWDPHDISVDYVVTPAGVIATGRAGRYPQPARVDWDLLAPRLGELPLLQAYWRFLEDRGAFSG